MKKIRCAIYTRKSSEEGLEQDFNSLHAQREACSAYILSQASEGWSLLPGDYDDGGLSGGTLERPALQRLLADIAAGKIDIVVVYKVDRLTRSLLDFAKLVEALDTAGTSFVSVTQSFNTTTSMGRLTLNMLLSFAQFEREVTAERIRDKIAASKAKGMWMGGFAPLGYKQLGRTLEIVPQQAELVRSIFRRYLELGTVRLLAEQLRAESIVVPQRSTGSGREIGGGGFGRGQIYAILTNPAYVGEIRHKGQSYKALHEAIVDRALWSQVQAQLSDHTQGQQQAQTIRSPSPLAGLVFDEQGQPLVATHACKGKVRYRYYVSKALQDGSHPDLGGIRISALELEKAVAELVAKQFDDPFTLTHKLALHVRPEQLHRIKDGCAEVAGKLHARSPKVLRELISRVVVGKLRISIELRTSSICSTLGIDPQDDTPPHLHLDLDAQLRRSGRVVRLVQPCGKNISAAEPQQHLVRLLSLGRRWWSEMQEDGVSASELAQRHKVDKSYVSRAVRLCFLAPQLVELILAGEQPASLNARTLLGLGALPLSWNEQHQLLAS
jgi:DNA invertase Pin-like site-specific DNA recombinase